MAEKELHLRGCWSKCNLTWTLSLSQSQSSVKGVCEALQTVFMYSKKFYYYLVCESHYPPPFEIWVKGWGIQGYPELFRKHFKRTCLTNIAPQCCDIPPTVYQMEWLRLTGWQKLKNVLSVSFLESQSSKQTHANPSYTMTHCSIAYVTHLGSMIINSSIMQPEGEKQKRKGWAAFMLCTLHTAPILDSGKRSLQLLHPQTTP